VRTARIALIVVGVVALAAVAKKWFTPGGVYVPEATSAPPGKP
jgi:hypothetical protein